MKLILIFLLLLVQFVVIGQTSTPISTTNTAVSTSGKHATLFRYKIKRRNGDTLSNYAWINTDVNGVILDSRARRLNNLFASATMALSNLPATYSIGIQPPIDADFQNAKYIGYMVNYPLLNIAKAKQGFDDFVQAGANEIVIPVRWEDVFQTYASQVSNLPASWAAYDDLITYAKNKGVKVSLRICVDMDDTRLHPNAGNDFYLLANSAKDEWGFEARIDRGSGHSSLAYATGRNMMLDFAQKAVNRYNGILGNQFLWYSVSITAQEEAGYNFENERFLNDGSKSPKYSAFFDYSTHAITGFKAWLTTKYGNVTALNSAWGSNYGSIDDASPPTTGKAVGTATQVDINGMFSTAKGKDWWSYHYGLIKDFAISAKALSSGMGVKFYAEFGSVSDLASNLRLSSNVKDFATITDGMKAQFGAYPTQNDLAFSMDVMRSNNNKKLSTEAHTIDFNGQFSVFGENSPEQVRTIATYWLKKGVESQLKEIIFIADPDDVAYYSVMKDVAIVLKNYLFSYSQPTATIATVNYSMNEILNNYYDVLNRWRLAGGETNARINMVQSSTIGGGGSGGGGGGTTPNILQIYDIAFFNFSDNNTKSSQFQQSYYNERAIFMCPTHSITYSEGSKAKSNYVIKSLDGKEWVRMTQTQGVYYLENNEAYRNNHPDRNYIPSIVEDCVFYLPIQDYDIIMTNTGATTIVMEVENPHQPQTAGFAKFQRTLAIGETYTYRVYASTMNNQEYWERAIKINNNKWY